MTIFSGSIVGYVLTISAVSSGLISCGQKLQSALIPDNIRIVGDVTGMGGPGTYLINNELLVPPSTITAIAEINPYLNSLNSLDKHLSVATPYELSKI